MKIGELFIQLGIIGDTKELDKTVEKLRDVQNENQKLIDSTKEQNSIDKKKIDFRNKIIELNNKIIEQSKLIKPQKTDISVNQPDNPNIKVEVDTSEIDKLNRLKLEKKNLATDYVKEYKNDNFIKTKTEENKKIDENIKKTRQEIEAKKESKKQLMGVVKGITAFIGAVGLAYHAMDRLITSFASANQHMINFQRTTGLSFQSLNKYASAAASVNFNSSIEGTAQTMANLAQNLYDIKMGRGDISPYQELAFVGGKAFNPVGMSVEQLIENVREAIKGVDDIQATNIIQRMGFSADDLLMLRMSREEFEKINNIFLSPKQREEMNRYALELKKIKLEFNLLKDKAILKIIPLFLKINNFILNASKLWANLANNIIKTIQANEGFKKSLIAIATVIGALMIKMHPLISMLTALYLVIEDIAGYFMGYKSVTGYVINHIQDLASTLSDSFNDSKIGQFFNSIVEGVKNVANQDWSWLDKINYWIKEKDLKLKVDVLGGRKKLKEAGYSDEQIDNYIKGLPVGSPINTNHIATSNNTNNVNTNNNFTINTNQPTGNVAQNLINKFTPTQVQFSTAGI